MNTARKIKHEGETDLFLQIIYGGQYISPKKQKRINDFWAFCYSTFWSTENFSIEQEEQFKKLIAEHFNGCDNINQKFKELVERATLAKRYIKRRPNRYIAKPIDWLNPRFKFGISVTEKWYQELTEQRKTVPHYNEGIALLAKALLSYSRTFNQLEISHYRNELIKLKQFDLLFLYTNAITHINYIN